MKILSWLAPSLRWKLQQIWAHELVSSLEPEASLPHVLVVTNDGVVS